MGILLEDMVFGDWIFWYRMSESSETWNRFKVCNYFFILKVNNAIIMVEKIYTKYTVEFYIDGIPYIGQKYWKV